MIINHTHMIETYKYSVYLSTYSNEAATSVLQIPSCREHQLSCFLAPTKITFSSYNWVEAPTSTCIGSNLYKENKHFSLAPPFHPCFSDLKHVQYNIQKNKYNIAYQLCFDLIWIYAPWFPSLSSFWIFRVLCHSVILTLPTIHASDYLSTESNILSSYLPSFYRS